MNSKLDITLLSALLGATLLPAQALDKEVLLNCANITLNEERLACYDRLADQIKEPRKGSAETPAVATDIRMPETPASMPRENDAFSLSRHYELDQDHKTGVFRFQPHYPSYLLLAQYNHSPNFKPYQALAEALPGRQELDNTELKFQLSFKIKMMENLFDDRADLWFGYTQQSFWQAYNASNSSPFRESNYAPELMLVVPTSYSVLGMDGKFVNVGLLHQSNGQGSSLSRSWNRLYAQAGFERDKWTVLVRGWHRFAEDPETDDNPDITDYLGHGDLLVSYRSNGHETYGILRHNFKTGRGATELGYAFPLSRKVKGFVRLFSGYGESLIDYNDYQNLIGLGFFMAY